MTVFKSTFLITAICFIIASCAEDTKDLPLKKITSSPSNNIEKKKAVGYDGPHNFYEYYQRIRTRAGDTKPRYSTNYKQIAFQKALKRNQEQGISRNTSLDWQERGPGNVSGRTRGILLDKRDSTYATWLVGSAGGGIWKTVDGGQNYQLKTATIPNMSTTTLAASDANPAIIYAGTGEGFDNQMITGDGIYKSLDSCHQTLLQFNFRFSCNKQ